jgi:hypothetical protein
MEIKQLNKAWGIEQYEWGWIARADFIDENKRIYNEMYSFQIKPSDSDIADRVALSIERLGKLALEKEIEPAQPAAINDGERATIYASLQAISVSCKDVAAKAEIEKLIGVVGTKMTAEVKA